MNEVPRMVRVWCRSCLAVVWGAWRLFSGSAPKPAWPASQPYEPGRSD